MTHPSATRDSITIAVIRGDGIGPELVDSALQVLHAAAAADGFRVHIQEEPGGAGYYRETGWPLAEGALDRLVEVDGVLKGPVGLPDVRRPDGTEAGLLGGVLRTGLDTFANVRPVRLLPGIPSITRHGPSDIDYVIVRENTEGLYLSRGTGVATPDAACDQLMVTRPGTERVCRFAFDLARRRVSQTRGLGQPHVTCVDKSNVLRSFALFRSVFDEVAGEYPDVATDHLYADAAAHALVAEPSRFDVLVMENFLGDVLSDLGAATVGGLGMCPSGNIGHEAAYFEPIHGSAPGIAGRNLANPVSQILSGAMLLEHSGFLDAAALVRRAVEGACADGDVKLGPDGSAAQGTDAVTAAVVARLSTGTMPY